MFRVVPPPEFLPGSVLTPDTPECNYTQTPAQNLVNKDNYNLD